MLIGHIGALRDSVTHLQACTRDARTGLADRYAAGDEYHSATRDAVHSGYCSADVL